MRNVVIAAVTLAIAFGSFGCSNQPDPTSGMSPKQIDQRKSCDESKVNLKKALKNATSDSERQGLTDAVNYICGEPMKLR